MDPSATQIQITSRHARCINLRELRQGKNDLPPVPSHIILLARVALEIDRFQRGRCTQFRREVVQIRDLIIIDLWDAVTSNSHGIRGVALLRGQGPEHRTQHSSRALRCDMFSNFGILLLPTSNV